MRVAFASSDCEHVNEQFRRSSQLVVYDVAAGGFRLDRIFEFPPGGGHGTDDRVRAIDGTTLVFVSAIGPSSAARLAAHGIRAATAPEGTRIQVLLAYVCRMLASSPGLAAPAQAAAGAR